MGLKGWVRNVSDGTVEGEAEGEDIGAIKEMKHWLSNVGSPASRIDKCEIKDYQSTQFKFKDFVTRH
uniref:acylphosphatase n=1 Tax=Arcella intermedia TaxID=1963864 RepID=A0A6B2LV18_9EUKA